LRSSCDDNTLHGPPMHLAGMQQAVAAMFSYVQLCQWHHSQAVSGRQRHRIQAERNEARVEVASWMRWAGNKDPSDKDT
jgi:hypothetical protein